MPWPLEPRRHPALCRGARRGAGRRGKARGHRDAAQGAALQLAAPTGARASSANSTRAGDWILPSNGELSPAQIARVIAQPPRGVRRSAAHGSPSGLARLDAARAAARRRNVVPFARTPYFCSGCPHNTSTRVPEGSRALAGIGCHYLSQFMDRNTATFTQMGGEGAPWIGQAPFTETTHVFANIGDGTYTHSGILAIRAAVAAGVNMTYKVLFNDAVAMTGGQPLDGGLTVPVCRGAARRRGRTAGSSSSPTSPTNTRPAPSSRTARAVRHRDELDHGAARVARDRRRHRDRLRPDLRRRETPPPQARPLSGPAASGSLSTIWFARAAAIARRPRTACRSCRSRPSSAASARSTSRAATRIFPASRASARALSRCMAAACASASAGRSRRATTCRRCPSRRCPPLPSLTAFWSPASAAPAS